MRHLANRIINGMGTLFSVRKVHDELKSLGYTVSRETITQFLQWLEDAYFIFSIPAYSASIAKQAREFRKIYCIDHSMAASLSTQILKNQGQMLENMVFCALRRLTPDIFYYKTSENYEVDFIAILKTGEKILVQVCHAFNAQETRNRELRALISAMKETNQQRAYIITDNYREIVPLDVGEVHILPASEFMADTLSVN
jgi:predicted AAA+ superfamily ATPase